MHERRLGLSVTGVLMLLVLTEPLTAAINLMFTVADVSGAFRAFKESTLKPGQESAAQIAAWAMIAAMISSVMSANTPLKGKAGDRVAAQKSRCLLCLDIYLHNLVEGKWIVQRCVTALFYQARDTQPLPTQMCPQKVELAQHHFSTSDMK